LPNFAKYPCLPVNRIGLGCMALSGIYGPVDRREAVSIIHQALDLGIHHFDTAELYGPYSNEELLAEALHSLRSSVQIATKFGYVINLGRIAGLDSRPSAVRRSVDSSLRRLKRDRIDLLYQHRVDPNVPIEETVGAMADLVAEGKVKGLGLCCVDSAALTRAQAIHSIAAVQNEYSLIQRDPETTLLPGLNEDDTAVVAYSPLGRGILSGRAKAHSDMGPGDYRASDVRFSATHLRTISSRLAPLWDIAHRRRIDPAPIALAWLLKRRPNIVIIPGAKSAAQMKTNLQAVAIELSAEECECLDRVGELRH
jgi:aryl-alcohol dehydrogenase-like predicted oxidoreductase